VSYLQDLERELDRAGIRGGVRRRILTEFEDHLSSDPDAELGAPAEIARQFADELGTRRAIRAALVSFAALAIAGALFAVAFLAFGSTGVQLARLHPRSRLVGDLAAFLAVVGPQLAFVAGLLAALRAFRHRHQVVIGRSEAIVIARRATVGVAAGIAAMVGMGLIVAEYGASLSGSWTVLAPVAAGLGGVALLAASPALVSAIRLQPLADGAAGDLFDDLGPLAPAPLRGHPWAFALAVSAAVAIAVALAGAGQSDPFDGAARGLADGAACLAGFGLLGRYLGIR
jgi:hypothetical protein